MVPLILCSDFNGGVMKGGFVKTTFEEEYKVRPDYLTNTMFVAHRQDVPEFKHFWKGMICAFKQYYLT